VLARTAGKDAQWMRTLRFGDIFKNRQALEKK